MRRSAALAIAVTLLIVSGCGGTSVAPGSGSPAAVAPAAIATASPRPTATATPRPTATPAPTPTATPAPKPTSTVKPTTSLDPSAGLKIAMPYGLRTLDPISQAAYEAAMSKALGSFGSMVQIGIRQVTKSGAPSGFVMVIAFTDSSIAQMIGFLDLVAGGSASSMGGKLSKKAILGAQVRYASSAQGAFAAYRHGEAIVYVILPTAKGALTVITALIKANR